MLVRIATFIAQHEFWFLWCFAVPFLIASNLPPWLFLTTLATVPLFWLARRVAFAAWSVATPFDLPILLLLFMGLVGVLVSADRATTLASYGQWLGGVALFYGLVNGLARRELRGAVWVLLFVGIGMGLVGLVGLRYSIKFLPVPLWLSLLPRPDITFLNPSSFTPNIVAGAVTPLIPLGWAGVLSRDSTLSQTARIALALISLLFCATLFLSQSRGAALGLVAGIVVLVAWRAPRVLGLLVVVAIGAAAISHWLGLDASRQFTWLKNIQETIDVRFELWQRALWLMQDFPFTGIGLGRFQQVVAHYYPVFLTPSDAPLPHAHNMYLQAGVDYGVPGLVAFLGLVVTGLGVGVELYRRRMGTNRWLAAGALAGYVVYLTHGLFDVVALSTKVSFVVWFLLALVVLSSRRHADEVDFGERNG